MCALMMKARMIDKLCVSCKVGPIPRDCEACPFCGISFVDYVCVPCKTTHTKGTESCPKCKGTVKPVLGEPLRRGGKFAKDIEKYLKAEKNTDGSDFGMPEISNSAAYAAAMKLRTARIENPAAILVEEYMGFPTGKYEDGGYFMTAGTDVMILDPEEKHIQILDWKTGSVGKRKGLKSGAAGKYAYQLDFYATMAFKMYPWVEQISTGLYFVDAIDAGRVDGKTYYRADARGLMTQWRERARVVMGDTDFKPTTGYWCGWCDFRKDSGGPCTVDLPPKKVKDE